MKHSFCDGWEFTRHWTEAFGKGLPVPKQKAVRLPHTCREVPLHYASPADYEMVCGYRKRFRVPPVQAAPRLFVRFDGAAHQAVVRAAVLCRKSCGQLSLLCRQNTPLWICDR